MNSNGKITAPVNFKADVATVLGTSNTTASALCTNDNINMWAKYKPVVLNSVAPDRNSEWWKGINRNCGIEAKVLSSYKLIKDNMDGKNNGWVYDKPKGGAYSPFRIADFNGYNHNVRFYIHSFSVSSNVEPGGMIIGQCLYELVSDDRDYIILDDLNIASFGLYFGIAIYNSSGGVVRRGTSSNPITAGTFSVTIPSRGMINGDYTVAPFLSSKYQPWDGTDYAADYYTIPNTEVKPLRIAPLVQFGGKAEYVYLDEEHTQKVSIKYSTMFSLNTAKLTVRNNTIAFRYSSSAVDSPLVVGEKILNVSDATIYQDGTIEYIPDENGLTAPWAGTFLIPADGRTKNWRIDYSFNRGQYKTSVSPMESLPQS